MDVWRANACRAVVEQRRTVHVRRACMQMQTNIIYDWQFASTFDVELIHRREWSARPAPCGRSVDRQTLLTRAPRT